MDQIIKQVSRARRLLSIQIATSILPWTLLVAFGICFVALLVPKIWYLPMVGPNWPTLWMTAAAVAALLATALIAFLRRPSIRQSALELDQRFGLRERVSSALDLNARDRDTPIGEALLQDAATKAERIDVRDQFPIRFTAMMPWVLLPILACVSSFWIPDAELPELKKLGANSQERLNNVKAQTKPILEQLTKMRKDLEEKGLQESAEEFKKLEKKLEDLQKSQTIDTKKLLADFNDIKKEMEQRKDSFGSSDSLKKAMDGLKKIDKGPADRVADSLKEGDFKEASKEMEKLLTQLKLNKLTDDQKNQLANQLKQMEKAIEKASQEQKDALNTMKQQLQRAEQAGDIEKAGMLRKKMEQLENAMQKAEKASKICEQCKNAAQALKDGDPQAAQKALEGMQAELEEMAADAEAMEGLQELMDEMQEAKESAKSGQAEGGNGKGKKKGDPSRNGRGEGQGAGDREESETDTKVFDSQVRDEMRKGETVFGGKVGGPNRKGLSKEEARNSILNSTPDDPDAIENMALPKAQRDQQREYFDSLRSGK